MYLQVKVAASIRKKNDTKPIRSLHFQAIANRPPIGTDIHRPVIINVRKVSYGKSVKMIAERLTSAAIIFFILLLIILACSCFCCYSGFFTACRFLSCTVPRRRFCSSLIDCQCCLSHLISSPFKLLFAAG